MKKKVIIIITILLIGTIVILLMNRPVEIYKMSTAYEIGSIRLKIYDNGDVYEDREIEEPNHKIKFKKVYTLEPNQIVELKKKIEENDNEEKIEDFIKETIYEKIPMLPGLPKVKEQN